MFVTAFAFDQETTVRFHRIAYSAAIGSSCEHR